MRWPPFHEDDVVSPYDYRRGLGLRLRTALARSAKVVWELHEASLSADVVQMSRPGDVIAEREFKLPPRKEVRVGKPKRTDLYSAHFVLHEIA